MFEPLPPPNAEDVVEIARYEVSEDGVTWRPYDPVRDAGRLLHTRMEFAPEAQD